MIFLRCQCAARGSPRWCAGCGFAASVACFLSFFSTFRPSCERSPLSENHETHKTSLSNPSHRERYHAKFGVWCVGRISHLHQALSFIIRTVTCKVRDEFTIAIEKSFRVFSLSAAVGPLMFGVAHLGFAHGKGGREHKGEGGSCSALASVVLRSSAQSTNSPKRGREHHHHPKNREGGEHDHTKEREAEARSA